MSELIAKIGDVHLGARKGCPHVRQFISNYILDYFLPEIIQNGIKKVIQVGDLFDVRAFVYGKDYDWLKEKFTPAVVEAGLEWTILVGNHDITLDDDNRINWCNILTDLAPNNFKVIAEPQEITLGETKILALPWVNSKNIERTKELLETSDAEYVIAHLELAGFPMYQGTICEKGQLPISLFDRFKRVDTGHFHTRSHDGKINYLGTPYHLTWQDVKDGNNRGFYIDDFSDGGEIFIPNTDAHSMFGILDYDFSKIPAEERLNWADPNWLISNKNMQAKIIKINVYNRDDQGHYDKFCDAVKRCPLINYNFIDHTVTTSTEKIDIQEDMILADIPQIIKEDVQLAENIKRPNKVCELVDAYYQSAMNKTGSL